MSFVGSDIPIERPYNATPSPMRRVLPQPTPRIAPCKRVQLCYTLMQAAEAVGIRDLADGEFLPTDKTLEDGIERQNDYLLDQVGCTRPEFRLLEIGCGYGRLLRMARDRGAHPIGVNVSPEQVRYCRNRGLQVYCCTYAIMWSTT